VCWYTFAGEPINLALGDALKTQGLESEKTDDYGIYFTDVPQQEESDSLLQRLSAADVIRTMGSNTKAEQALKYHECLPASLSGAEVVARRCKVADLTEVLGEARDYVVVSA
jgi:hypothetical protein